MKPLFSTAALSVALAGLVAGCGSSVNLDETPVVDAQPKTVGGTGGATTPGGSGTGVTKSQVTPVDLGKGAGTAGLARVVYFDYDSFIVKEDYRSMIEGHARALSGNKGRRMVIEGHADERGGREYNLALGQRRAEAVLKSLALLGANESQLEAISYGKERPVDEGHDEAAWAKNRRAELKDR